MNLIRNKTTITTLLFSLLVSSYMLLSFTDRTPGWPTFYGSILPLAGVLSISAFLVVLARATVVTWITVLVLLAFAGKRRRRLVFEGRKITVEVAVYLVKVVLREKGLVAAACATIVSLLMAVVHIREAY